MKRALIQSKWILITAVIATILFTLPGRTEIAPAIGADNSYIYLAADRMYDGHGPTSLFPRAPHQPWQWQADWAFLTQWPVGYPAMLCGMRMLTGQNTVEAGQTIAILACAVALVAWFAWSRRILPKGVAGTLLAAVAAGSAVSTAALINPGTDILVAAILPLVLMLASSAFIEHSEDKAERSHADKVARLVGAGLLAGSLFWLRYASIYIPTAIGVYLLVSCMRGGKARPRHLLAFGLASAIPILTLVTVNQAFGLTVPLTTKFNLASELRLTLDAATPAVMWWQFTKLPFYDYHWYSQWFFAVAAPWSVIGLVCMKQEWRKQFWSFLRHPGVVMSICVVVTLFVLLGTASTISRDKHTYADLQRYYVAVKPFYFLLFVGPLLCIPRKWIRALACIPLVLCLSWYVQQEWPRPYKRWLSANRPTTPYGRWARQFEPASGELYGWLRQQTGNDLVVFSNFHDDIALETQIPACPTPTDRRELKQWLEEIRKTRGVDDTRILFVLNPENCDRDYFLVSPETIKKEFDLVHPSDVPQEIAQYVYEPSGQHQHGYASARAAGAPQS